MFSSPDIVVQLSGLLSIICMYHSPACRRAQWPRPQAVVCVSLNARAVGCLLNHASAGSLTSMLLKRLDYRVLGHFFDGSEVQGCLRGLLFRGNPLLAEWQQ